MGGITNEWETEVGKDDLNTSLQESTSTNSEGSGTAEESQTSEDDKPEIRIAPKETEVVIRPEGPRVGGLAQPRMLNQTKFSGYENIVVTHILYECTTEDLNECLDVAKEYYGFEGNIVNNKPNGVDAFGMRVLKMGGGAICQELRCKLTGNSFSRIYDGINFTEWSTSYTTDNKPLPEDIKGGLKLSSHDTPVDDKYIVKATIDPLPGLKSIGAEII